MYLSPGVVIKFIDYCQKYPKIAQKNDNLCFSRSKLPCTYCNTKESTTWRPGPCGPSTLCNKCGVAYMESGRRHRTIDLIVKDNIAVWMKRDSSSWEWKESYEANMEDLRVQNWFRHENIKKQLSKDIGTPPPAKRMRI